MRGDRRRAQLIRTLTLLRALDHAWCSLPFLAEHFGVTPRTIRRDVAFLRANGFTIQERAYDVTDDQKLQWKLTAWPEQYDLTKEYTPMKVRVSA